MKIVNLNDVPKTEVQMDGVKGAFRQLPLSAEDGAPTSSFRVFTVEPGGHTPHHTHPFEHMNYVISGEGALVSPAGEAQPIKQGDFALVLAEEKHQYRNTSETEPLVFICAVPNAYA